MRKYLFYSVVCLCYYATNAQKQIKDTLFFKYDKNYIKERIIDTNIYYVLEDSHSEGTFFFQGIQTFLNLKPEKKRCLKKYVRNSEYYDKSGKRKLYDYGLYDHLRDYTIFLVKGKEYIKVEASYEIE